MKDMDPQDSLKAQQKGLCIPCTWPRLSPSTARSKAETLRPGESEGRNVTGQKGCMQRLLCTTKPSD